MKSFLQRFGSFGSGVFHGFDRLRLRGSKRLLFTPGGVSSFLSQVGESFEGPVSSPSSDRCNPGNLRSGSGRGRETRAQQKSNSPGKSVMLVDHRLWFVAVRSEV